MEAPSLSAVSNLISAANLKTSAAALPLEVLHNLQHQHNWTNLRLHRVSATQNPTVIDFDPAQAALLLPQNSDATILISGLPPRQMYVHPDLLNHLVQHNIKEDTIDIQREWVMPMSTSEKWSLKRLSGVFDCLPQRQPVEMSKHFQHHDSKRIFLGMLAHNGMGGDGTIVYYIMQEGEVKPRQN